MKLLISSFCVIVFVVGQCDAKTFIGKRMASQGLRNSVQVLAAPAQFAGRRLFVDGFVRCIESRYYLYSSFDDASRARFSSAIWLGFNFGSGEVELNSLLYDGAWVAIEGVFHPVPDDAETGYGGGTIREISYLQVLSQTIPLDL
jgi:hypothetical protein